MNQSDKNPNKSVYSLSGDARLFRPLIQKTMQMKKYLLLVLIILTFRGNIFGQQTPNYTMYMMNPFVYNPALAGTSPYYQIRSNHRFQWVGLKDAPITNSISAYGPHKRKTMGYGGTIYNDVAGPESRMGINGVYAYNIAVNADLHLSMGLSLGLMQYKIDGTEIKLHDSDDAALNSSTVYTKYIPDASVGLYLWSNNYYVGFSANQLLNNKVKLSDTDLGLNKLKSHFYLMGGYIYKIDKKWQIEPGLVIQKVTPAPFQVEIFAKAIYQKTFWGGLAFRTQDAVSIAIGYIHDKKIFVGYSFDLSVSDIRKYNSGSHEVIFGFNFDTIKKLSKK
jgi:type IX secretion system PorP/SprF family membrane protein